jgi:hypothetical protein
LLDGNNDESLLKKISLGKIDDMIMDVRFDENRLDLPPNDQEELNVEIENLEEVILNLQAVFDP